VGTQQKQNVKDAALMCSVTIDPVMRGASGPLEALAREAHEKICPYSHATRGNVQVDLEVAGA
jgi:lipoyl-dependent peroxiredoxin